MSYTDLLTIAMPVYERKDFFLEAIESALNQTVKCKVIVVDNCSSHDYFEKVCKEKGVTYYRNETNIGLFPNFNRCFELATTDFVMTLQDDDIISPMYVESFLKALEQYPAIDIYFTDFQKNLFPSGVKEPHRHTLPFGYMENGEKLIEYGIRYGLGFPLIASCIKRSKFTGFYTDFHSSNDWLWFYSNADQLSFFGDSRVMYYFRDHEEQDTKKNSSHLLLSLPYIFGKVLAEKAKTRQLRRIANRRAFWTLVLFKSQATSSLIEQFIKTESLYGVYLDNKIKTDWLIRFIFKMPPPVVSFFYKSLRKLKLIS